MSLTGNREQRLYIATICLSVIAVLLVICLMIIGILWYMDKKNCNVSLQQKVSSNVNTFAERQVYESEWKDLLSQLYSDQPNKIKSEISRVDHLIQTKI